MAVDPKKQKQVNQELETTTAKLDQIYQDVVGLDDAFTSLGRTIEGQLSKRIKGLDAETKKLGQDFAKDLIDGLSFSKKGLDDIEKINNKIKNGQDASKDIEKARLKTQNEYRKTLRKIEILERNGVKISAATVFKIEEAYEKKLQSINAQEELNEKYEEGLSVLGKTAKAVSQVLKTVGLGALETFIDFEDSIKKANKKIIELEETSKGPLEQAEKDKIVREEIAKGIDKSAIAAAGLLKASVELFKFAQKIEQKVTDLSRNLSISKDEARDLKKELKDASGFFNLGVTIQDQIEAINALNKGLGGVALTFDKETRVAAAETLKRLKLSEESVGNMGVLALATGKSFEELEDQQIASVLAAEEELGIRLNLKDVLDEANQITGQTRLNILKFPGGLTKAVSVAKSLGVEMDAISSAAGQLLNFEESIAKELEAELLIGRDLNLEAARQAALTGDQETLMKELVAQAGSLEKLQSMNVIQQQALAGALGLSADQLADQVLNGEALATQKDEQLAREAAAAEAQAKQLSATEATAVAMQKLADVFSFAVPILVGLAAAAAFMAVALSGGLAAGLISKGILKTGIAIGVGTAAAVAGAQQLMGDGTIPPGGPFAITDTSKPFGSTVITTKGDGIAVSPNIRQEGAGNASMAETNKLLRAALSRPAPTVNLDSIEIGTVAGLSAFPIQ